MTDDIRSIGKIARAKRIERDRAEVLLRFANRYYILILSIFAANLAIAIWASWNGMHPITVAVGWFGAGASAVYSLLMRAERRKAKRRLFQLADVEFGNG